MAARITREVLDAYIHCETRAYLKLASQQGSASDYAELLVAFKEEIQQTAVGKILERHPESEVARDIPLTLAALRAGRIVHPECHPGRRHIVALLRRAKAC